MTFAFSYQQDQKGRDRNDHGSEDGGKDKQHVLIIVGESVEMEHHIAERRGKHTPSDQLPYQIWMSMVKTHDSPAFVKMMMCCS